MSLGNNRDYKTNAQRVNKNLARHRQLWSYLVSIGLPTAEASTLALTLILTSKRRKAIWRG